ncbi:MAG: Nif11-like leader peptide family natural product precursor [Calothrix sp. MO_167.B42]|nr:Nif11-like leader peptide family natural product precursor [Calothrix sp. MO_167.B42]
MSGEILEKVKSFLVQLVKDESFRNQLMSRKVEDVKKIMADGGYQFSRDEFETAVIQILELKELGQFQDLTEDELVGAVGGLTVNEVSKDLSEDIIFQPLYGVIVDPSLDICVCKEPPIAVTHYGSIMLDDIVLEQEASVEDAFIVPTSDQPEH